MNFADVVALLPLIIVAVFTVATMFTISLHRDHRLTAALSVAGLALAVLSIPAASSFMPRKVMALLVLDSYAFFFMGLLFFAAIAVALFAYGYLEKRSVIREEFYLLLLLASFGAAVLVASSHFVSFFLGLETLSVSLYAMLAYLRTEERGIEASLKYLIPAAASSAVLLFGMALLYAQSGTMEFGRLTGQAAHMDSNSVLFFTATVLVIAGFGFKLALVPFHMWTPDVYEGSPLPVTAFVATVSKGAVFGLLLRYFGRPDILLPGPLALVFSVIAVASMFAGNFLALFQNNVKRILAYSSIAHLGYLLVAFLASGPSALPAVLFYLIAYFIATLAAFGTIILLSGDEEEADALENYRSLAWRRPWIAAVFTVVLLSLAGIPLTAGFLGKFYLLFAGVNSSLWFLVITLVVSSAIGLFYYLRIIQVMFHGPDDENNECFCMPSSLSPAGRITLALLFFLIVWLGVNPGQLIDLIQSINFKQ